MASCELDYRLSSNMESMEYDGGESSEDEARLSIVEGSEAGGHHPPRKFIRSLSVGDGSYNLPPGSGAGNASDAVESLLLLGQRPVLNMEYQDHSGAGSDPGTSSGGMSPPFPRFSGNPVEQRMMVNYYQKMRERNNEASKRCRLKRRIKQDSLDKTRILLESHREALSHRVAKLHKIKNILNDACRGIGQDETLCDCRSACSLIKAANREMPDLMDLSNFSLLRKSRKVRDTNLEEELSAQDQHRLTDLRPLKRGPRKQEDPAAILLADTLNPSSPSGALDLSSSSSGAMAVVKREAPGEEKKYGQPVSRLMCPKAYVPLAPKAPSLSQLPLRKIIMEAPALPLKLPSGPLLQVAPSSASISLSPFSGTNTIILTPLGQPGLSSTIFSLPTSSTPCITATPLVQLATKTEEPVVVIKSEPDMSIVEMEEEPEQVQVKQEEQERDPTTTCCAALVTEGPCSLRLPQAPSGPCSQELIDLNSLTQMLDLVTMEPKLAGELTAAEKNIIKSRLRISFWKAEEAPSFICSAHRQAIVQGGGLQVCSVCAKRKSKKFDMYFITYRMAVEFYMTEGKYLSIGRLACSSCKSKGLKGLDFSNSYLVPEFGHPLDQGREEEERSRRGREEEEEKRGEKREVILQPLPPAQGKLATIQPLPPRPQPRALSPRLQGTSTPEVGAPLQRLHSALAGCNPLYRAPGFTITNLAECSEGVLQDAVLASQMAVSTILTALAPGQEEALWQHVSRALTSSFTQQPGQVAVSKSPNL